MIRNDKLINYLSCHDNNTLWDKLIIVENNLQEEKNTQTPSITPKNRYMESDEVKVYPQKLKCFKENLRIIFKNRNEKVVKRNKLAAAVLMLSFGVPFFQAGEEGARTKLGEGNSYNLSKSLNQIDWKRIYMFEDLVKYYRKIIKIRKTLQNCYELSRAKYNNIEGLPKGIVGFHIHRIKYGKYKEVIIIFNSSEEAYTYKINGNGKWIIILDEGMSKNKYVENKSFIINAISTEVIVQKDQSFKENK